MASKLYVAYGSNLNLEQMARRCPKAKVVGIGNLKDYQLTFRRVATIEPEKGIAYSDEVIERKEGKTGGKGKK